MIPEIIDTILEQRYQERLLNKKKDTSGISFEKFLKTKVLNEQVANPKTWVQIYKELEAAAGAAKAATGPARR